MTAPIILEVLILTSLLPFTGEGGLCVSKGRVRGSVF
jgi:hypothetical protein